MPISSSVGGPKGPVPYVTIDKSTVNDHKLSFTLRGFLIFLLSKPEDWQINPRALARECGISGPTVYRHLAGLVKGGYMIHDLRRKMGDHGHIVTHSSYQPFRTREACQEAKDREKFTTGDIETAAERLTFHGQVVPF